MSFLGSGNSLCKGPGEEMCLVFSRLARKAVQLKWSELEGEKQKEVREGAGSQVTQSPADHVMECGLCSQGEPRLLSRNLLAVFLGGSLPPHCSPGAVLSHSVVSNSATPWTVAHQAPLSMGLSRPDYWSGLPCPPPGDLPIPGIKPRFLTLQVDSLPAEPPGKPLLSVIPCQLGTPRPGVRALPLASWVLSLP